MTGHATIAQVREALDRTSIMALATLDDDGGSWTTEQLAAGPTQALAAARTR
jgi:hypothetical protein